MRIPVQVKAYGQTVLSNALIDSGAEGKFIDSKFVAKHRILVRKLVKPIPVHNVDGTPNQNGTITHYTLRPLLFGNKLTMAFLLVTSLGKEDIILGLPWLKQRNPLINWKEGTISIRRTTTATSLAQRTTKTIKPLKDSIPAHYHNFIHLFEKKAAERFPIERPYDHAIDLKPDFVPRDCKLYSMTPKEELALDEFLTENLRKGYIRPSKSPMASPFFFIGKKDNTLRPCQDYRALNEGTIKNAYPLPLIGDLMDKLRGAKYFTKLDLRSGYNNIRIKEGDQYKAAFKTIHSLFEPTVMFFGLCNSPATFQMFMNDIFRIIITEEAILIYMDDILIFSDNLEDLRRKTNRVLKVLQDNDLFLKPEKCVFEVQEVEFLGMIICPDNIHMDPVKLAGIQQWPEPHTVKQLRSFLGFCNFYRRFIPNYSSIAYPLNELTRTNEPWKWNELHTNAFITLKNLFSSQLALLIPDKTKPFILETDASKNLSYFQAARRLTPRQSRWNLFLSQFDISITHKPGKDIPGADSLSRRPDYGTEPDEERTLLPNTLFIGRIDVELHNHIKESQATDQLANTILRAKTLNIPSPFKFSLDDWTTDSDLLLFRKRIYIPDNKDLKQQILHLFHDLPCFGHPGIFKTTSLIRQHYWWPGLTIFVKNFINGCAACQQMKINTHPTTPPLTPIPADPSALPFQSVSIDFITDLPLSNSFDSLMVIVDHDSSKGIVLCPCNKTIDALGTALLYHQNVYRRFGLPKRIISDRGPQFASHVFQTLCSCLGIKSKLSTAYHPQTDGQTERANQEIEAYLRIYCGTAPNTWAESIPDLEFSHNLQTHSVTKTSPFNIILGYNPIPIPPAIEPTNLPSLSERLRLLSTIRKEALAAHDLAQLHMARHTSRNFTPFKLGDKVWLEATHLHFPNRSRKLSPKREGPFTIKQVLSPLNYRLKLPKAWRIHPVFHASLLTPFAETDSHGPSFTQPPPDLIDGHEEFEIEAIVSHSGNGKRRKYLIKWKGYPSSANEWLKEADLK
ncbi:hypothetical protein EW145_g7016 [Phellinidium pouzarii]|uniref:Reverse transcriptase n=1 Tax=Phellinidium pouzarii TaxID=167371 RepID=A0A4S4KRE4_9AGAM|nr:hypothetical protein EW145_g7016 [Phellinidium pouzarii]